MFYANTTSVYEVYDSFIAQYPQFIDHIVQQESPNTFLVSVRLDDTPENRQFITKDFNCVPNSEKINAIWYFRATLELKTKKHISVAFKNVATIDN